MTQIPTNQFKPKLGTMRAHLFENPNAGIEPTLFYDITIPLELFDSGLDYELQPEETSFRLDSIKFPITDWRGFDGQLFEVAKDDADGSIYLGSAHNPVDINLIRFTRLGDFRFWIECMLFCDFGFERVADNATVELSADVEFEGMVVELNKREYTQEDILNAKEIATSRDNRQAHKYLKEVGRFYARERALEIASQLVDLAGYAEPESKEGRIVFKPRI